MKIYNKSLIKLFFFICLFAISACVGDSRYDKYFSSNALPGATAAKSSCNEIYGTINMSLVNSKMAGTTAVKIPTAAMMKITDVATEQEMAVIKSYEEAHKSCVQANSTIGIQTTAMEDILQSRLSSIRYGLYSGEVPYGVYNYAVVQAMKEQASFTLEASEAYAEGKKIGEEKFKENLMNFTSAMNESTQASYQSQIDSNRYYSLMNKTWTCTPSFGDDYTCE